MSPVAKFSAVTVSPGDTSKTLPAEGPDSENVTVPLKISVCPPVSVNHTVIPPVSVVDVILTEMESGFEVVSDEGSVIVMEAVSVVLYSV